MHLVLLSLLGMLSFIPAATPEDELLHLVESEFKIPPGLEYDCRWTYAIISVQLDGQHNISDYRVLAANSDSLTRGFDVLKGKKIATLKGNKPAEMIFGLSVDNENDVGCRSGREFASPREVLNQLVLELENMAGTHKNAIVVHSPALFFIGGVRQ